MNVTPAVLSKLATLDERDRLSLEVLYWAGLRKGELRDLRIRDLDLNAGTVSVTGGTQALPPSVARRIKCYVRDRQLDPDEFLLYPKTHRLRPMDPANIHRWFKRCLEQAGLPETIQIHEFRFASRRIPRAMPIGSRREPAAAPRGLLRRIADRVRGRKLRESA